MLLTHGHLDHVYAVTPVCDAHGVAASIHEDDVYRLANPLATLDPALVAMFEQQFGCEGGVARAGRRACGSPTASG